MTFKTKLIFKHKFSKELLTNIISDFNKRDDESKFGSDFTTFVHNFRHFISLDLDTTVTHKTNLLWMDDNDNIMASITIINSDFLTNNFETVEFGFAGIGKLTDLSISEYDLKCICWESVGKLPVGR
jgi:hypothetical protein